MASNAKNLAEYLNNETTSATADIADGSITAAKLASNAVTTAKIADDAVTGAKIENTPSIANGLTLSDGNLVVASGHGIDFSANSSASGMSSELFDHYEEGTFDVTIRDATSGGNTGSVTQTNKYIRVGNTVWMQFNLINITTTGLTSSNVLYFTGLPFTPASGSYGSGTGLTNQLNVDSGCFQISMFQNAGQSYAALLQSKDNTGSSSSEVGAFDNATCDLFAEMLIQV